MNPQATSGSHMAYNTAGQEKPVVKFPLPLRKMLDTITAAGISGHARTAIQMIPRPFFHSSCRSQS